MASLRKTAIRKPAITDKYTSAELSNFKVRVYGAGTVAVTIGDDREIGPDKDGKAFD